MKNDKKIVQKLIVGVFLCCILFGILALYANMLQEELSKEVMGVLEEVAQQSVVIVNNEIQGEFAILKEIADRLSVDSNFSQEKAIEELKEITKRYSFKRMGIIPPDGEADTTDDVGLYLGDREFFEESMLGNPALSDKLRDKKDGEDIIVFSVPIYEGEKVCSVLFATYKIEELQKLLSISVFDKKGYSYVVADNGDAVMDTVSPTGFDDFTNVYSSLKEVSTSNLEAAAMLRNGLENGETGFIRFHNKIDKYMYYSPLGIKGWYVLNVVPTGVMDSTTNVVMLMTYALCIALVILFLVFVLYIIKIERQKKKELSDILYVDGVTGGYSFARFCVEARMRLESADDCTNAAYIMMDIDKFKVINELFGYEEGDRTLCHIWKVWKECSRENEIYARRIADRFVALWYFDDREELNRRIENIIEELQSNMQQFAMDYNLKTTLGIYIVKDKKEDVQNMMNYAVMAHSSIKGQDDSCYAFYDDDFREKLLQNKILEDQMKRALKDREFIVYYQPKYSVMTKELVGAEALVRWRKEDGSTIMPNIFIPLAEKNGFINFLDKYIFTEVCIKQKEWLDGGMNVVPISVNLSRRHLYNDEFMEEYKKVVDDIGLPPEYVQLELTESAIFENQEALCQIIDRLHSMGFRILMDDFGTGYSSLMMLKSVPIDILKLDKSFVDDFDDPRGEKIITSVIQLAQALRMEVTAEGVETEEQYRFLKNLGCNTIQGFYFARPMPNDEFEKLLEKSTFRNGR